MRRCRGTHRAVGPLADCRKMWFVENGKAQRRWNVIATLKETDSIPYPALKRFGRRARFLAVVGRHRARQGFEVQVSHALKRRVVLRERFRRRAAKDDRVMSKAASFLVMFVGLAQLIVQR